MPLHKELVSKSHRHLQKSDMHNLIPLNTDMNSNKWIAEEGDGGLCCIYLLPWRLGLV